MFFNSPLSSAFWRQSFFALLNSKIQEQRLFTVGNIFWTLLGSASTFGTLYLIFESRFGQHTVNYPSFLLCGICIFNFFTSVTSKSIYSLINQRDMLLNTPVKPSVVLFAELTYSTLSSFSEVIICVVTVALLGELSWQTLWLLPLFFLLYLPFAYSVAIILVLLASIYYRTSNVWYAFTRILIFATPIFYSESILSPWGRALVTWCNPVTPFIGMFREIVLGAGSSQLAYSSAHGAIIAALSVFLCSCIYRGIAPRLVEHL